jgi:hypothetical protein
MVRPARHFFGDHTHHYQTQRALNNISYGGADTLAHNFFADWLDPHRALDRDFTMNSAGKAWTLSSIVLAAARVTLIGTGLYFMLLRPPLLPEDIHYMGLSAAQMDAVRPQHESWLAHVFQVMGGYPPREKAGIRSGSPPERM